MLTQPLPLAHNLLMMNTDTTKPDTRIKVVCLECGKKFSVRVYANECPKCGGVDIDVR